MQVNNYSGNQSFGMALCSSGVVNKALKSRISKPADLELLSQLIEQASRNDVVDIQLFARDNKLSANVYTRTLLLDEPNYFVKSFSEGWFQSPVKFIKKLVNYADKEAEKISSRCSSKDLDDVLNKMNTL